MVEDWKLTEANEHCRELAEALQAAIDQLVCRRPGSCYGAIQGLACPTCSARMKAAEALRKAGY